MAQEFEGRDLSGAVFWSVDLTDSTFNDVDLSRASIARAMVVDVDIDGLVEGLVVNGVDVTDYVNARDRWYPLRTTLRPTEPADMRSTWSGLGDRWREAIEGARRLRDDALHQRVDGEWSIVETLRHLVFAYDKWFGLPVLGGSELHPLALPNSGSADFGWVGVDRDAAPSFDEVLEVRAETHRRLSEFLDGVEPAELDREVEVRENGTVDVRECIWVVFEEEFEHLRYALRDLAELTDFTES